MKYSTKKLICILLVLFLLPINFKIAAHSNSLDIDYDGCKPPRNNDGSLELFKDGLDEMWYCISNAGEKHISEQVTTIKYYFEDCRGEYDWT